MGTRPRLVIDLQGTNGNIYMVIAKARQLVPSDQLDTFINATLDAQRPGANKIYEDMLAIINSHVELVDSSGTYPAYADKATAGRHMNEAAIIAAVDRFNAQLRTLPDWVPCSIDGLYPEFDYPDHSPEIYLALVEDEVRTVKARIDQADESQREPLQQLLTMLVECSIDVQLAGVTLEGDDDPTETPPRSTGDAEPG